VRRAETSPSHASLAIRKCTNLSAGDFDYPPQVRWPQRVGVGVAAVDEVDLPPAHIEQIACGEGALASDSLAYRVDKTVAAHRNSVMAMIEVAGVSKIYETPGEALRVLDGVDLELAAGEAVAIVGPSGSGKTTLLNLLGALDRPSGGSIRIADQDVGGLGPAAAARFRNRALGLVFQQHHLLPQLSVLENVLVPRLAGDWEESAATSESRARELLGKVGLEHRLQHLPWQLSGGERLRAGVARALLNRPRLLLADEPTGLLDQAATDRVADLLLQLNAEQGVTMIVVTHNAALARKIGRTFELTQGKLQEVGR